MPIKVLFLDDEPEIVELFVMNFSSEEVEVAAFTDPAEAVERGNSEAFDLMFLDYRMKSMSGEQVAQKMPASVPKCLLTGEIAPKLDYPFVDVIQKPFVNQRIGELIADALRAKNSP